MKIEEFLLKIQNLDVRLWLEDDKLKFKMPKKVKSPELMAELKSWKYEIIEKLKEINMKEESIPKILRTEVLPISYSQQSLWLVDKLTPGNPVYNIFNAVKIKGDLDIEIFKKAVNKVIKRHETLRTVFPDINGKPVQKILDNLEIDLNIVEIKADYNQGLESKLKKILVDEAHSTFDLENGPLLSLKLFKIGIDEFVVTLNIHHIVSDGTSNWIFIDEVFEYYKLIKDKFEEDLEELKVQFVDYAAWQRKEMEKEEIKKPLLDYWKDQLENLPTLNMPTDFLRPVNQNFKGNFEKIEISKKLTKQLKEISLKEGATLFISLFTVFGILLHKYTDQEDLPIGTVVANRNKEELRRLIADMINPLLLRCRLDRKKSFLEILRESKKLVLDAFKNQSMPYDKLVEELNPSRDSSKNALFQVMFIFQNIQEVNLEEKVEGLDFDFLEVENRTAALDLKMQLKETKNGIIGDINYSTELFKKETINRMVKHFISLLDQIVNDPQKSISEFQLIKESEVLKLYDKFNNKKSQYNLDKTVKDLFEEQVGKTPDNIALEHNGKEITYKELNNRANILAEKLRGLGVKADVIVGMLYEKSFDIFVGILAILKAGGAYLPVDPNYPQERIKHILDDSGVEILLIHNKTKDKVEFNDKIIFTDEIKNNAKRENLESIASANDLAYIIYTSGSTGKPKGVMIENRNLSAYINSFYQEFLISSEDVVVQQASYAFDAFVEEMYPVLLRGGKLVIPNTEAIKDIPVFSKYLRDKKVTLITCSPLMLNELNKLDAIDSIKVYISGGDVLKREYIENLLKRGTVYNTYGPTEGTVCATYYRCEKEGDSNIPIGKSISNYKVYILNKDEKLLDIGIPGELCIAGPGVARAYLNREELTKEKFIFSSRNEKMYKTGDLVKVLSDGNIEFLGRIDNQVNIRGYRIELGEIENYLLKHNLIDEVVVIKKSEKNEEYICAYYTSNEDIKNSELRKYLLKSLPEYMIPAYFIKIDKMPLTSHGKINKNLLPEPKQNIERDVEYVAPRNSTEEKLLEIWQEVLGIEKIGIDDNFFMLGGQSLTAISLIYLIEKELDKKISLVEVLGNPTIKECGTLLRAANLKKNKLSGKNIEEFVF